MSTYLVPTKIKAAELAILEEKETTPQKSRSVFFFEYLMSQIKSDMATPILDIARRCLDSFDQIEVKHNESRLIQELFTSHDTTCTRNFLRLRYRLLFWLDDTSGGLSSLLDKILQGVEDTSLMVTELLEMVLINLQRCKFDIPFTKAIIVAFV